MTEGGCVHLWEPCAGECLDDECTVEICMNCDESRDLNE